MIPKYVGEPFPVHSWAYRKSRTLQFGDHMRLMETSTKHGRQSRQIYNAKWDIKINAPSVFWTEHTLYHLQKMIVCTLIYCISTRTEIGNVTYPLEKWKGHRPVPKGMWIHKPSSNEGSHWLAQYICEDITSGIYPLQQRTEARLMRLHRERMCIDHGSACGYVFAEVVLYFRLSPCDKPLSYRECHRCAEIPVAYWQREGAEGTDDVRHGFCVRPYDPLSTCNGRHWARTVKSGNAWWQYLSAFSFHSAFGTEHLVTVIHKASKIQKFLSASNNCATRWWRRHKQYSRARTCPLNTWNERHLW